MSHIGEIIQGYYTQPSHGNPNSPAFRFPVIEVSFGAQSSNPTTTLVGMLDTGADLCLVDESLVADLPAGATMPTFQPDGSTANMQMYQGKLVIPQLEFSLSGEFKSAPFRSQKKAYDIILGMDFIRFFEMNIQPREESVWLRFLGVS